MQNNDITKKLAEETLDLLNSDSVQDRRKLDEILSTYNNHLNYDQLTTNTEVRSDFTKTLANTLKNQYCCLCFWKNPLSINHQTVWDGISSFTSKNPQSKSKRTSNYRYSLITTLMKLESIETVDGSCDDLEDSHDKKNTFS